MDQKRLEYLRQVERHADETGWVAPLTQEDKDHFAYLRKVFKRYNIAPSKATPTEYDFVVRVYLKDLRKRRFINGLLVVGKRYTFYCKSSRCLNLYR